MLRQLRYQTGTDCLSQYRSLHRPAPSHISAKSAETWVKLKPHDAN